VAFIEELPEENASVTLKKRRAKDVPFPEKLGGERI